MPLTTISRLMKWRQVVDTDQATPYAKRFAIIALSVLILSEAVTSCLFVFEQRLSFLQGLPAIPIAVVIFNWVLPFLIVYKVEKRTTTSLGLSVPRENYRRYALYAIVGLLLPAALVRVDRSLIIEFIEQIVYIGMAEELFSRGYLMRRLCDWLGDHKGLFLNALIFGLSHVTSRISQHGLQYPARLATVFVETFVGGLLLGYIYLRAKNIVPGSILHVSTNVFIPRIIEMLSG